MSPGMSGGGIPLRRPWAMAVETSGSRACAAHGVPMLAASAGSKGLLRELNPGPLAPEARIMPLDQAASGILDHTAAHRLLLLWADVRQRQLRQARRDVAGVFSQKAMSCAFACRIRVHSESASAFPFCRFCCVSAPSCLLVFVPDSLVVRKYWARGWPINFPPPRHAQSIAETRDRTGDLQIFSLTLSQLSYRGSWQISPFRKEALTVSAVISNWSASVCSETARRAGKNCGGVVYLTLRVG